MKNKRSKILAIILTATLLSSLALGGCGSLSRILAEPDPPREDSDTTTEFTRLLRTGSEYAGIEIFHGTKDEPYYSPDKTGYLYEDRGWVYLHLEGDAEERGYQHGWLLADYIQLQIDHNVSMLAQINAIDWEYLRVNAERMWTEKVTEEYRLELEGIVKGAAERGATFDYLDLLVMNGLEELRDCWFPTVSDTYYEELARGLWEPEDALVPATAQSAVPAEDEKITNSSEGEDTSVEETAEEDTDAKDEEDTSDAGTDEKETSAQDTEDSTDNDSDSDASDKDTKEKETSPESHIATLPYVEIEGLTDLYGAETITRFVEPSSIYTKQAVAILATGSATKDGSVILAQNTLAAYADSNFSNVMIDVEPSEGERFTMQAAPGFIHSVGEAYSSSSLVIANTRISGFNVYSEEGTPEFLRIRTAVQYSENLNDFTKHMLEGVNGGIASNWLVGDIETGQIMELELGLSFYNVQKLLDGCFISFGGVDDTRILNFETDGVGYSDTRLGNAARFVQLADLSELYQGELTTETAQDILSDHYDSYISRSHAGSRSICAHYDLDDAEHVTSTDAEPHMPYGTVGAKVMSSDLAEDNTIIARWGSACGSEFNATEFITMYPQYIGLQNYLYDRTSEFWIELSPASA